MFSVWYKIIVENNVLTLTCITYLILTTKTYGNWRTGMVLMINGTKNNTFSHEHNIVHFISTRPVGDH